MAQVAVAAAVSLPPSLDHASTRVDTSTPVQKTDIQVEQLSSQEQATEALAKPNHDPHVLPSFETRATSPILYLPPLLSSLPVGVGHAQHPTTSPAFSSPSVPRPLSTESRLPSIDPASLALHRALHHFRPTTEEYAKTPYPEAFNWNELELPLDEEREWYCVVFRSRRRDGSDGGRTYSTTLCLYHVPPDTDPPLTALYEADKKAHEEAVQNGGVRPRHLIFPEHTLTPFLLTANPLLVRHAAPRNWVEPRDVHLAVAHPCGCRQLASAPHPRDAACRRVVRAL